MDNGSFGRIKSRRAASGSDAAYASSTGSSIDEVQ